MKGVDRCFTVRQVIYVIDQRCHFVTIVYSSLKAETVNQHGEEIAGQNICKIMIWHDEITGMIKFLHSLWLRPVLWCLSFGVNYIASENMYTDQLSAAFIYLNAAAAEPSRVVTRVIIAVSASLFLCRGHIQSQSIIPDWVLEGGIGAVRNLHLHEMAYQSGFSEARLSILRSSPVLFSCSSWPGLAHASSKFISLHPLLCLHLRLSYFCADTTAYLMHFVISRPQENARMSQLIVEKILSN